MKLFSALVLVALSTVTTAQYYDIPSPPFRLFVKSTNSSINGTALGACHQGAAIEGLCITGETAQMPPSPYTTFYHNVSSFANQSAGAANADGPLSWTLRVSNLTVPSAMFLSIFSQSNVANPTFYPGTTKYDVIAFDEYGSAYISATLDDTVSPPTYFSPSLKVKNWYICYTRWSYSYYTLSWKVGLTGEPQNPSCQKVDIVRVFN